MDRPIRRTHFPLTVEAPGLARRWVHEQLTMPPQEEQIVLLLLSEVVGNSVRHSGSAPDEHVEILLREIDNGVHVEVCDPGPGQGIEAQSSPEHSGLHIVEALSDRWGVSHEPTTVWFDVTDGATHGAGGPQSAPGGLF